MDSAQVRLGILGAGDIFRNRHLPNLTQLPNAKVVVVCNRSSESSQAVADAFGIEETASNPAEVIARDDLDAIMIGAQPHMHCEWSIAVLESGKHVFCQARMARNLDEARSMLKVAEQHPKQVSMLCPAPHVMPAQEWIRQHIAKGALGQLRLVRVHHLSDAALNPQALWHWRLDDAISGYNTLALGMFAEIIQRWVGKARSVSASAVRFTNQRPDAQGRLQTTNVPESVVVTGVLENRAQYVYTVSALAPSSPGSSIEIYGDEACLFYDLDNHQVRRAKVDKDRRVRVGQTAPGPVAELVTIPAEMQGSWQVEQQFLAAILHGGEVFPNFDDGVGYMEFTEAALRAAAENKAFMLPLP